MKSDVRYVFDTNVVISALLFEHSTPGRAFYAALEQGAILISLATLAELDEVLGRTKFERYVLRAERERFLEALIREATLIEVTDEVRICRDPKDDKFLELASSGKAHCIVSGDRDLLQIGSWRDIPIVAPAEFLAKFASAPLVGQASKE